MISERAGVGMVWFRYRAGVVGESERLVHVADPELPLGPSYLISPCGWHFDRRDVDESDDPARFSPPPGQQRAEPCLVCVMRAMLAAPDPTGPDAPKKR